MKNKTILFISPHIGRFGAEKSLVTLLEKLKASGENVKLIIPQRGYICELLDDIGVDYVILKFYCWTNIGQGRRLNFGIGKFIYNLFQSFRLVNLLKKQNFFPDIVHSNVITSDFGFHLSKRFRAIHIWHIREFGKIDFNMDFDLGFFLTKKCLNTADLFIANSKAVQGYYIKSGLIKSKKICVVHNGVDMLKEFSHDFHSNPFKIILVGRIGEEKNQIDAVKAIKILIKRGYKNIHLDLYGDGFDLEIEKLNVAIQSEELTQYVELKGYVANIDYSSFHLGLMCSRNEAFGRVTVEYMLAGLPVIGANTGGTPEIISSSCGFLYDRGNCHELANLIERLINNRDECEKIANGNRRRAEEKFSQSKYVKGIVAAYRSVEKIT